MHLNFENGYVPVVLAPMAGVNDIAFRQICLEMGADFSFTEMVSSKALQYSSMKSRKLLDAAPNETRVGVQLFGHEPQVMAAEAAWVQEHMGNQLACIDINMGCPARKIVKKGDGSALLKTPDVAAEIVRSIKTAVTCPVTVKFRKGYAAGEDLAVPFAQAMEQAGADLMTVHGRTTAQMYSGKADWDVIARVKSAVDVPVIGNGDVTDAESALAILERTGCDGIMVARGAQGNPWVFSQVRAALDGKPVPEPPTIEDRVNMAKRHAAMLTERFSRNNLVYMRKHVAWYLHGVPGAARARGTINSCKTLDEFNAALDQVLVDAERIRETEEAYYRS